MPSAILTLNAGSSSLKFALFDTATPTMALLRGEVSDLNTAPHLVAHDSDGNSLIDRNWQVAREGQAGSEGSFANILTALLEFIDAHRGHDGLSAVGHRVVHGGADHIAPERVIPTCIDHDPLAHFRRPMVMIRQG